MDVHWEHYMPVQASRKANKISDNQCQLTADPDFSPTFLLGIWTSLRAYIVWDSLETINWLFKTWEVSICTSIDIFNTQIVSSLRYGKIPIACLSRRLLCFLSFCCLHAYYTGT